MNFLQDAQYKRTGVALLMSVYPVMIGTSQHLPSLMNMSLASTPWNRHKNANGDTATIVTT
jgi:hypothetical protein